MAISAKDAFHSHHDVPGPASMSTSSDDDVRQRQEVALGDETEATGPTRKRRQRRAQQERSYSAFNVGNDAYGANGKVSKRDGRLNISINKTTNHGYIAKALGQTTKHHLDIPKRFRARMKGPAPPTAGTSAVHAGPKAAASEIDKPARRLALNIVIMVIESWGLSAHYEGSCTGFIEQASCLTSTITGRAHLTKRIWASGTYRHSPCLSRLCRKGDWSRVLQCRRRPSRADGLYGEESSLIPSLGTIRQGEVQRRRAGMAEMFQGFWRACVNANDGEKDGANS